MQHTITEPATEKLTLLTLPAEVRIAVFTKFFSPLEIELLSPKRTGLLSLNGRSDHLHPLSLLGVSKQVRRESLPLLHHIKLTITALYAGWHQALPHYDALGMPRVHSERIKNVHLQFLDTNFHILKSLPELQHIYISPPGETQCKQPSNSSPTTPAVWPLDDINSDLGHEAMREELLVSMRLMYSLLHDVAPKLSCLVHYNVGMKFRTQPAVWSQSGRLLSSRGNYYSVRCEATGVYDSQVGGVPQDAVTIHRVTAV